MSLHIQSGRNVLSNCFCFDYEIFSNKAQYIEITKTDNVIGDVLMPFNLFLQMLLIKTREWYQLLFML